VIGGFEVVTIPFSGDSYCWKLGEKRRKREKEEEGERGERRGEEGGRRERGERREEREKREEREEKRERRRGRERAGRIRISTYLYHSYHLVIHQGAYQHKCA
jgi:hypothetical protein